MTMLRVMGWSAAALGASLSTAYAGPCSAEIDRVEVRINAKLDAIAGATRGEGARESVDAMMRRQPTPKSIAAAEEKLGGLPREKAEAVAAAMKRARAADQAGDQGACDQALADAQRVIGP